MTKKCSKCFDTKPIDDFYQDKRNSDGRYSYCRNCHNVIHSKWSKTSNGKNSAKKTGFRRRYGLTLETFSELWEDHNGKCAICEKDLDLEAGSSGYAVDHNHQTNEVRGLLCPACNTGIGLLGDNPNTLQSAMNYLNLRGYYGRDVRKSFVCSEAA